jgi:hypothetical protein
MRIPLNTYVWFSPATCRGTLDMAPSCPLPPLLQVNRTQGQFLLCRRPSGDEAISGVPHRPGGHSGLPQREEPKTAFPADAVTLGKHDY